MTSIFVSALLAAIIAAFFYHRSQPPLARKKALFLAVLRFVSLTIALMLLINPILRYYRNLLQKQEIILLSDVSQSMKNEDKAGWMKKNAQRLEAKYRDAGYKVIRYSFARGLQADASDTRLMPALQEIAAKHDLSKAAGILLFSDGWLRDPDLSGISQLGIPILPMADTSSVSQPDLAVEELKNNRHSYRNEPTLFKAQISSKEYTGAAEVKLISQNSVLASKTISLKEDEPSQVEFTHTFKNTGFYPVRVEVSAPNLKEKILGNNFFPGAIEILADKERIVMISDQAAWDNKFIMDVITANPRWQSRSYILQNNVLKLGERQLADFERENPVGIVVVNNGSLKPDPRFLEFIRRNYKNGSGILWQGMPFAELSEVLALAPSNVASGFQGFLKILPTAQAYPILDIDSSELKNIPPLSYHFLKVLAGAQILANIDTSQEPPAIAIRSGAGRVINLAFLDFWRWQLQSPGSSYRSTINNMLTWISNRSGSSYRAIHANSYFQNQEISIRLRAEDDIRQSKLDLNPRLIIKDDKQNEVYADFMTRDQDEYTAKLSLDTAGDYSFEISENGSQNRVKGQFNIASGSLEERDHHYNLPLLKWLAAESRGRLINQSQVANYNPPKAQNKKLSLTHELPLYRKWYILSLFLLSFCTELFFRRRWGLL